MSNLLSIAKAAHVAGVTPDTLRRWEREGKLRPVRTAGGQRRYRMTDLRHLLRESDQREPRTGASYERVAPTDGAFSPDLSALWNEARKCILVATTQSVPWPANDPIYRILSEGPDPVGPYFQWTVESTDACARQCEQRVRARLSPGVTLDLLRRIIWQTIWDYTARETDRRIRADMIASGLTPD